MYQVLQLHWKIRKDLNIVTTKQGYSLALGLVFFFFFLMASEPVIID